MQIVKSASLFLLILLFQGAIQAQEWTSYQSPNQVNDLVDTGDELLLATDAGLVVVNKSTLERKTFNKANSNLTNNHVQSVTLGTNGSVWVGTYDIVLSQFDGTDFQDPTSPTHEVLDQNTELYDFKISPNGDAWVATNDGVFHREGQSWSHYGSAEFGERFFESWDIETIENGDVFVVGREIHQFVNGAWVNLSEGTAFEGYLDADAFSSRSGDLYVAGDLDQIFRFDGQDWQGFPIDFNGSEVIGFTEDVEGGIYFSTLRNGIFKLENDTFVQQADAQAGAFSNMINFFHIDEENRRWMNRDIHLSENDNGVIRSALIAEHTLETNNVGNVHKGDNGKMYFITRSQENISVRDTDGTWSFLPKPPSATPFEFFNDILVLADDNILVATNRGFYQYNGSEWAFTSLDPCRQLDIDSQGKVYIRSDSIIYIMDNGLLSEYNTGNSSLTSLPLSGQGIDANDNLWISSGDFELGNVIQTVSPDGSWTTYTAADHPVIKRPLGDFHFNNDGNVWIINEPAGALKFDGSTWTDPVRETDNGQITNRGVQSIQSDEDGKLYFAHEYGISTLLNGEWENFINEEVTTNNSQKSAIVFDDEGILWWANGRTGVFSFKPEVVSSNSSPLGAVATRFSLYPNPAQTYTTLDFTTKTSANVKVAIFNQIGQLATVLDLGQMPEGTYQREINTDRLPKGFYTVQLQINNSSSTTKMIIR
ncbi:MAG: T9SS type A sorting domain-containing protein [Lewinella sp.]